MSSIFYNKLLPDYTDTDNKTRNSPGYWVYIVENDGGIGLKMIHANKSQVTGEGTSVFLNIEEAQEMLQSLEAAISRARSKNI